MISKEVFKMNPENTNRTTDYTLGNTIFRVAYGDITKFTADALVSSDDSHLTMGGGVSAALSSAGGDVVYREARKHIPLDLGDVAVTSAGKLSAKFIFHAVTISYEDMTRATKDSINRAVVKCLQLADTLGVKSIVFPALGTGVAGFPYNLAAESMTRAIADYLIGETNIEVVTITLLGYYSPIGIDEFYERAVALASVSTQSKRLDNLVSEMEKILSSMNNPQLLKRVSELKSDIHNAQNALMKSPDNLEHLEKIQDESGVTEISKQVVAVSTEAQETTLWEDTQLEAEVIRTKLNGLLTQLNIQTSHLNRFQIEKAKYGGQLVPPRLEIAIEDITKEIQEVEERVQETRAQLTAIVTPNKK